ncbi:MAG TPA: S8 family serine peptidase [Candidatus Limnocylindrales bacterium]|nr:S8 family serine peptidase [Candidatus Limnocylindrales bacterium]
MKLKSPLAEAMESWVAPYQPGVIQPPQGAQTWLAKHNLSRVEPVYPKLVRAKRHSGQSYRQMAELVREKFPKRAARRTDAFNPPEVARTYVMVPNARSLEELERILAGLRADPMVEFAQREQAVHACFVPNDPYFSSSNSWGQAYDDLYGVKAINCPAAWDVSTGSGIIVAVLDTGIDYTHLDITNNVWINPGEIPGNGIDDDGNGFVDDVRGWDFIGHSASAPQQDNDVFDRHGHGTHVAGTIAAQGNNGLGVIGVAWGARVMAVKAMDDSGSGWDWVGANAIVYAANNGADVINASWGGQGTSPVLEDAVNYAASLGVVFVAAAGNDNADEANFFPANCSAAISVAALDPYNNKASFSNFGNRLDVAAPGVDILSLRATNTSMGTPLAQDPGYTRADGTSMAAPHVSGVAALVLSQHPTWSSEEIRQVLRSTADDVGPVGRDDLTGYGRVNALRAVQAGPALEARILSPANESTASPTMTVAGVAQGPGFGGYILDYGPGDNPINWLTLATGSSPVNHSDLGTFQTSALPDGLYTIRLRALSLGGGSFEDRIQITVDYDFITTPSRPAWPSVATEYKPGASISVVGTAAGLNFRQFRVEWARGLDATSGWTNRGIALVGGGLGSVTNGLLATWDSGGIIQADYYTIRLLTDRTTFTNEAKTYVYLEPDLYSTNWPQWFGQPLTGSVLPARDAQDRTRLIVMNAGNLWSFGLDGTSQSSQLEAGSFPQMAVGDVEAAHGDEVVVADNVVAGGWVIQGNIKVFPANAAAPITNFPSLTTSFDDTLVTLADLTGDGVPEILALGAGLYGSSNLLYAWNSTGTLVSSNFPIAVSGTEDNLRWLDTDRVMPLLGSDGRSEMLVVTGNGNGTFSLKKYMADGRPAAWPTRTFNGYPPKIVSGDVNGDGVREIVISYYDGTGYLEVLSTDGATLPGWPVRMPNGSVNVVVADLDRDGVDEIVAEDYGSIYVFRGDGTPFSSAWPLRITDLYLCYALTIADVNGDGFPEILTTGLGQPTELRAYDRDARLVRSWKLLGFDGHPPDAGAAPLVGDFDGNGKVEIAVNYLLKTGTPSSGVLDHGALTVLALDVPFIRNPHDWPMAYHDPQNTANDFAPLTISGTIRSPMGTPIPGAFVSFSNGAGTTTTDTNGFYSLALDPGWSGTATPNLAGYSFYPASESYTNVKAGEGGQDYTAMTTTNSPPVIGGVSNQFVVVGQQLVITNWAFDPYGVTFSLGVGSPAGVSITTNGIFTWTPVCDQGSTTNLIVIWATDFGTPPMSNSVTFSVVVPECIEASLGNTVMLAGTTNSVPVQLLSTTALTNLAFRVVYPAERFDTNFTITVNSSQVLTQQVRWIGTGLVEVTFTLPETSVLHGPTNVAELGFTAVSNQHSAFVPLPITDVTGLKPDGTPIGNWYGYPGRVALIGDEPLLEAFRIGTNDALVILYGRPGTNYTLLSTTNGLKAPVWLPEMGITSTNLETWIIWTNQGEATRFFRAKKE